MSREPSSLLSAEETFSVFFFVGAGRRAAGGESPFAFTLFRFFTFFFAAFFFSADFFRVPFSFSRGALTCARGEKGAPCCISMPAAAESGNGSGAGHGDWLCPLRWSPRECSNGLNTPCISPMPPPRLLELELELELGHPPPAPPPRLPPSLDDARNLSPSSSHGSPPSAPTAKDTPPSIVKLLCTGVSEAYNSGHSPCCWPPLPIPPPPPSPRIPDPASAPCLFLTVFNPWLALLPPEPPPPEPYILECTSSG